MKLKYLITLTLAATAALAAETGKVGQRPYELDWANRVQDHCPPLVDFEDLSGWTVQCQNAEAQFERTR